MNINISEKKNKLKENFSVGKILASVLIIVFIIRLFSYESVIANNPNNFIGLDSSPLNNKFLTICSLLGIWLQYTVVLILILRPFFSIKTLKNMVRCICPVLLVFNILLIKPILILLKGDANFSILMMCLILEFVVGITMCIYYFFKDRQEKIEVKSAFIMLGIFLLLMVASMPAYIPQFFFGKGHGNILVMKTQDIAFGHRILLYLGVIIPVTLYFTLRNKSEEVIDFTLLYISVAVLVSFLVNYDYTNLKEPWTWPFHLCNTALFIIPLCLIFRMKKLFYFTYYINVLGAVLAMLMPNYDNNTNILSMRIFTFWYNHWVAAFMPLLLVALKRFERPKLKQFIYSMIGFLVYFILVLFLNVYFTALGKNVDYFFINSDYVGDKLGTWGTKLFNISTNIQIGSLTLSFHPIYQFLFFLGYVLLGLGVWFIYNEFFMIADRHFELHIKLKKIKLDEIAIKNSISPERMEQMKLNLDHIEAKFKLHNFSKKYASSKVYAVKNASFEVNAGEIFGFLGPNGAGKSTIIKSVVGIQPITEGSIEICGFNVKQNAIEAKACIGYVPDHYALYEKLTGREYINYIADIYEVSLKDREERLNTYIKIFELEKSIDSQIKTYSHGMKQKITIMAALIHNPKVWILDEPLTGLDPSSIYQVKECMKYHASQGNIVFFSSHLIDIVEKLCSRIAIIKQGTIQCVKTLDEIEKEGFTLESFYLKTIDEDKDGSK